jgi:hypothetical protein
VKDPVNSAELAHDQKQTEASRVYDSHKEEALSLIVEDFMAGEKVRGLSRRGYGLQDFLEDQTDLAELVSAAIIKQDDFRFLTAEIERRLKAKFEDFDAVSDRCWELDQYERERAKERE